jgi:hypothetical protein
VLSCAFFFFFLSVTQYYYIQGQGKQWDISDERKLSSGDPLVPLSSGQKSFWLS